jgi:hypothetical protein
MHSTYQRIAASRAGAAMAILFSCALISTPALAQTPPSPPHDMHDMHGMPGDHEAMAKRYTQHLQEHMDALAARLEIKASQEAAWQAFSGAFIQTMIPPERKTPPAAEPDAAALARDAADRATAHAQQLVRLADASAKLQEVLGPDQRAVFNEAARHFAREHMMHGSMVRGGMMQHGEAGGHMRGSWDQGGSPPHRGGGDGMGPMDDRGGDHESDGDGPPRDMPR